MYSMKMTLYLTVLSVLLLSVAGCSGSDAPSPKDDVSGVTLQTRGGGETAGYRLLVFEGSAGKCLVNQSFGSGNESVRLANGTYGFVTLSGVEGFDLPVAGTTVGIDPSVPVALKAGGKCSPVQVSVLQEVGIPGTSVYEVALKPATCLLKLELKDAPGGVALGLTNMYGGVSLTGSYAGDAPLCSSYPLDSEENICLPTKGNAVLQYTGVASNLPETSGTLDLGMPLEPGYTYSFTLQWQGEHLKITSTVEKWKDGDETTGDAE